MRMLCTISGRRTWSLLRCRQHRCSTPRPVVVCEANSASAEPVLEDQYYTANLVRVPRAVNTVRQWRGQDKAPVEDR